MAIIMQPLLFHFIANLIIPESGINGFSKEIFLNNYFHYRIPILLSCEILMIILVFTTNSFDLNIINIFRYISITILFLGIVTDNLIFHYIMTGLLLIGEIIFVTVFCRGFDFKV